MSSRSEGYRELFSRNKIALCKHSNLILLLCVLYNLRHFYTIILYFVPQFHPQITLDREEWFDVTPRHRLGILNELEPVPILYGVINQPMVVISTGRFAGGADPLELGSVQTFDELEFPYRFALDVRCVLYTLVYTVLYTLLRNMFK